MNLRLKQNDLWRLSEWVELDAKRWIMLEDHSIREMDTRGWCIWAKRSEYGCVAGQCCNGWPVCCMLSALLRVLL